MLQSNSAAGVCGDLCFQGAGWIQLVQCPSNIPKNTGPWGTPEFPWLAAKLNGLERKCWQRSLPCAPGVVGPDMIQGPSECFWRAEHLEAQPMQSLKLTSLPPTAQISSVIPIYVNVSQRAELWMITQTPFLTSFSSIDLVYGKPSLGPAAFQGRPCVSPSWDLRETYQGMGRDLFPGRQAG